MWKNNSKAAMINFRSTFFYQYLHKVRHVTDFVTIVISKGMQADVHCWGPQMGSEPEKQPINKSSVANLPSPSIHYSKLTNILCGSGQG